MRDFAFAGVDEIDSFGSGRHVQPGRPTEERRHSWRGVAVRASAFLSCDETLRLLHYWRGLGRLGQPPRSRELHPEKLGTAREHIWLMDFEPASRSLYYRMVGEDTASRYNESLIGRYLHEIIDPEAYPRVAPYFLACVERPAISIVFGRLFHEWPQPWFGERLLLPLFDEKGAADGLVGVVVCRKTSLDKSEAEKATERRVRIIPLDGGDIVETVT